MSLRDCKIDKSVPIPLYFQLKELLLSQIDQGDYPVGSMIPTENEISDMFAISRTTVRQAITELVSEGRLYRVKSKGTFVCQPKINQDFMQILEPFNDQIRRLGMEPSSKVLDFQKLKADEAVAEHLQLQKGADVYLLFRERYADGSPVVTVKTYIPCTACPSLMEHDFAVESLYGVLGRSDESRIHHVKRTVEAVEAAKEDAVLLGLKAGKPIQFFTSIGYNQDGKPIEYSLARYRGDRNQFEVTVYTRNE